MHPELLATMGYSSTNCRDNVSEISPFRGYHNVKMFYFLQMIFLTEHSGMMLRKGTPSRAGRCHSSSGM